MFLHFGLFVTLGTHVSPTSQSDFGKKGRDIVADCAVTKSSGTLSESQVMTIALNTVSCVSYLQGFTEASSALCIPVGVSPYDMELVVAKYGADHPEKLYELRGDFVQEALSTAYPCRK